MNLPKDYLFTENHEWIYVKGEEARVGITEYAQEEMGDIVFVELPEEGEDVIQFEEYGVIESVKAVSDIYIPASGRVTAVNEDLLDQPELINEEPYENGWIAVIDLSDDSELDNLMDSTEYASYLEEVE